jgi:hypothetical protein
MYRKEHGHGRFKLLEVSFKIDPGEWIQGTRIRSNYNVELTLRRTGKT